MPLTHVLRIVRGVILKGAGLADMDGDFLAMTLFAAAAAAVAMLRCRRTLDLTGRLQQPATYILRTH